jgi:hypothetical protein
LYTFLISPSPIRASSQANYIPIDLITLLTKRTRYDKIKVKVKLSLCFITEHHAVKSYCGSRGKASIILDLGARWRWVVSFTPRPLYPRERAAGTRWTGGRVGPRAGLNAVTKKKNPGPCRDSNPRSSKP